MSSTAKLLFEYLRDMIYNPEKARLDTSELDAEFQNLGEGLVYLCRMLQEQRNFVMALSRGDLSGAAPSRENELAAPLKSLHASLRHLTWQTQQVALGDYQQRVDFMGEFSSAFNQMIEQLDSRQQALTDEISQSHEKSRALLQSNNLLTNITAGIPQSIIVLSNTSGRLLFTNPAAEKLLNQDNNLPSVLNGPYPLNTSEPHEIEITAGGASRFYSVSTYAINWSSEASTAFVLNDISEDRKQLIELEHQAVYDSLTGVKNRYAGMKALHEWLDEGRKFALCFIDLDNLKYINDNAGHSEGDVYIIKVAELLGSFSPDVEVSRIGGDEFMVLAPDFNVNQALTRLAELDSELNRFAAEESSFAMSISYGTVQSIGTQTARELLSIADERMYDFKRRRKTARQRSS